MSFVSGSSRREQGRGPLHAAGQICEQKRVLARSAALLEDLIVTGNLTLEHQPAAYPPNRWLKPKYCLNQLLKEVGPIIAALEVRQFMPKNRFSFFNALSFRKENHRVNKTDQDR